MTAIKPAIMAVGGWYDGEDLLGTLQTYKTIEKRNPGIQNTLVMGPWMHSSWNRTYRVNEQRGPFPFTGTSAFYMEKIEFPAELYVSTTGTDADWVVRVIDVYPGDAPNPKPNPLNVRMGNYQRLIRGDIIRGKFRESFKNPEPFVPGKVTKVTFELPDIAHTFQKGHRIMVHVQSSWFPLFDRNPQTFCNIREAGEKDFQKATHRVYRTADYPSGIWMWLLPEIPPAKF